MNIRKNILPVLGKNKELEWVPIETRPAGPQTMTPEQVIETFAEQLALLLWRHVMHERKSGNGKL